MDDIRIQVKHKHNTMGVHLQVDFLYNIYHETWYNAHTNVVSVPYLERWQETNTNVVSAILH